MEPRGLGEQQVGGQIDCRLVAGQQHLVGDNAELLELGHRCVQHRGRGRRQRLAAEAPAEHPDPHAVDPASSAPT